MVVESFLIADHPIYGEGQLISDTLKYPWKDCMVTDELRQANERIIERALSTAEYEGYTNIQEVRIFWKWTLHNKAWWGRKKVREAQRPFSTENFWNEFLEKSK